MFQAVVYGGEGVFDRKDETSGELLEASSRVHQCRGIREKIQPGHAFIPASIRVREPAGARIESFGFGDVGGDAPEKLARRLDDLSCRVLGQITPAKDDPGMV